MINRRRGLVSSLVVNGSLLAICTLWLIPTVGLLVSSFRTRDDVLSTGWWSIRWASAVVGTNWTSP